MTKVYIVGGNYQYSKMFLDKGWEVAEHDLVGAAPDLIQFTGGEDVTPELYNEQAHPNTFFNKARDEYEVCIFNHAKANGIPMAGICRGGQFLNVMNGGRMYQHVDGHAVGAGHIAIDVRNGEEIRVSSTHHQMFRPAQHGELLTFAREGTWRESMVDGKISRDISAHQDEEVVYYPSFNSLCFQPHPEFPGFRECTEYYFKLLKEKLQCAA